MTTTPLPLLDRIPAAIASFFTDTLGMPEPVYAWLAYFVIVGVLATALSLFVAYVVLAERKIAGYIQERPGPNRVGPWGLLQSIADVVKLFTKEDIIHDGIDKPVFKIAPFLAFAGPFTALAAIPFGPGLEFASYNLGLLMVFAFGGLTVIGILAGAYASNNKFSLMGGLRGASQLLSYEIPFLTTVLALPLIVSMEHPGAALNLSSFMSFQADGLWLVAVQPVGFVLFVICMLAETNRTPFDIPEGESEITGGFHTEYSGFRFAMFFLGEYTALIVMSMFGAVLYLGGWAGPPAFKTIVESPVSIANFFWLVVVLALAAGAFKSFMASKQHRGFLFLTAACVAGLGLTGLHLIGSAMGIELLALGPVWLLAKVAGLMFVAIVVRWTYLRLRLDQLTGFAWKFLFPIALLNLAITAVVVMLVSGGGK